MNSHKGMEQANATSSQALNRVVVAFCLGCCGSVSLPNWIRPFIIPPLIIKTQPTLFLSPHQTCASVAGQQAANSYTRPNIQITCRDFLS